VICFRDFVNSNNITACHRVLTFPRRLSVFGNRRKSLLSGFEILMALSMEDVTVNFAQLHHLNHSKKLTHDSATIVLAGAALLVAFLICLASLSPDTATSDLASMTVLP
jgi:hypothetical protein